MTYLKFSILNVYLWKLFSLVIKDGLHRNFFGQAIIANQFIKAINLTYQSNIPFVNILRYKGIQFPE
jgi:hypothetical protein